MASIVPMQPYLFFSVYGLSREIRVNKSPISGVNMRLRMNAQPKPMLRLLPTSPTRTDRKQSESNPNMMRSTDIIYIV